MILIRPIGKIMTHFDTLDMFLHVSCKLSLKVTWTERFNAHVLYPVYKISNSTFCPHSVSVCFVWIWEQTAIISLYSINWLVFMTKTECVYCAVRTGYLNIIRINFSLKMPLIAEARYQSKVNPCGIFGGWSDHEIGCFPSTAVFPCQYHSINAPYSYSSACCCYQKCKQEKLRKLLKSTAPSEAGKHWIKT